MDFVNITGPAAELDSVLVRLSSCGCFHIEQASKASGKKSGYTVLNEENPYAAPLRRLSDVASKAGVKLGWADYSDFENKSVDETEEYISESKRILDELMSGEKQAKEQLSVHEQALYQVSHLQGINVDFEQLFHCEHVKVRLGRLPSESFEKLSYYDDKPFFFMQFSEEMDYYWGMYFVPFAYQEEIDEIFDGLYFERTHIPDFVHGNSETALADLYEMVGEDRKTIEECQKKISELLSQKSEQLNKLFSFLKTKHDNFELRSKAVISEDKFQVIGFVPKADEEGFKALFSDMGSVSVNMQPADAKGKLTPPIKLKNGWFTKPFSLFVEMYGLPSYNSINPTTLVAVTYTLLFGIMFGDFGQGIVLTIFGALMAKFKNWSMGPIIARVGVSGAVFGLLYGSVFGYEELLDPLYERLGIHFLPLKIMDNVALILIGTIALGVVLMIVAILINIFLGIKNKDYANALFSNNGIAGLVFFGSILAGLVGTLLGAKILTAPYVICLIILPLIMMFMREPLACWVRGKKYKPEGGAGDFIASNFFEVFEFLLGYTSNTLSFVRVGGFALSHASMMLVVMALAKSMSGLGAPIMVVFGNIFVMGIEGLLVCIQTMRLEFYEMFSRFYSGDGVPFTPVKINYDETIE